MRIAILLGAAVYDTLSSIPAASNDVAAVAAFLGHGALLGDRLTFPMSDYSEDRRRQTSLENDEIDEWLRGLSPKVAVKVLDCCYSGVPYVKSTDDLKAALESSTSKFRNCYFFLSSQENERSYAGSRLSHFTEQFLQQVLRRPDGPVRYKDLMDGLADRFDGTQQRPQFIVQAPMREVFFDMDEPVRKAVTSALSDQHLKRNECEAPTPPPDSPLAIVEREAASCIGKSDAEAMLRELREKIEPLGVPQELGDLYALSVNFAGEHDFEIDLAGEEVIGKWLQGKAPGFFARPIIEEPRKPSPFELAADPYRSWDRGP